jgi:hypothetical protein
MSKSESKEVCNATWVDEWWMGHLRMMRVHTHTHAWHCMHTYIQKSAVWLCVILISMHVLNEWWMGHLRMRRVHGPKAFSHSTRGSLCSHFSEAPNSPLGVPPDEQHQNNQRGIHRTFKMAPFSQIRKLVLLYSRTPPKRVGRCFLLSNNHERGIHRTVLTQSKSSSNLWFLAPCPGLPHSVLTEEGCGSGCCSAWEKLLTSGTVCLFMFSRNPCKNIRSANSGESCQTWHGYRKKMFAEKSRGQVLLTHCVFYICHVFARGGWIFGVHGQGCQRQKCERSHWPLYKQLHRQSSRSLAKRINAVKRICTTRKSIPGL